MPGRPRRSPVCAGALGVWIVAIEIGLAPSVRADEAALAVGMPGPADPSYVRGDREKADARCVTCHAGLARGHATSRHRAAFRDPSFQAGYRMEPESFCRGCHAPEARPNAEPDAWAAAVGVTCVTCHQPKTGGPVLASARPGVSAASSPHPIARIADFGTQACARCHEFSFPSAEPLGARGLMQKTVSEHAASAFRAQSCASCHMPRDGTTASHELALPRDLLRRSVRVTVTGTGPNERTFQLEAVNVGHALPTGDLFRRLVLRIKDGAGHAIERPFGRLFRAERDTAGHTVRFESRDERLAPQRRVTLALPTWAGPLRWELVYQRVLGVEQQPPFQSKIEEEIPLGAGAL
jgi:hypothetical protein